MKPAETIIDYTRHLAAMLGLAHWRIDLDVTPADDDALASMRVISGQQRAILQIGKQYAALTRSDRRSTILHELIHIWLWGATEAVEHAQPHLGTVGAQILAAAHDLAIERATDGMAVALAPFFPLPAGK